MSSSLARYLLDPEKWGITNLELTFGLRMGIEEENRLEI